MGSRTVIAFADSRDTAQGIESMATTVISLGLRWYAVALGLALVACGAGDPALGDPAPLPLGSLEQPIINGNIDTTHDAVVLVGTSNSACSGTLIAKNGATAFVLTAAHCGDPEFVLQGDDYESPDVYFSVAKSARHPGWKGTPPNYDFMMVQVSGAEASTPVIPAMSPAEDSLMAGATVRHVGYGKAGPAPGAATTERHELTGSLATAQPITLTYKQPNGGPCSGDSGGPQLTLGTERVAGVTSAGDVNCKISGVSGRVSAVYDTFIVPFINDSPPAQQTCDQCTQGATTGQSSGCYDKVKACLNDGPCGGLVSCLEACGAGDQACVNGCASKYGAGIAKYNAIFTCVCEVACVAECAGEALCDSGGGTTAATSGSAASGGGTTAATSGSAATTTTTTGGAGGAGDDGWVAGDTAKQDYDGVVLSSQCGLAARAAIGRRPDARRGTSAWSIGLVALCLAAMRRSVRCRSRIC